MTPLPSRLSNKSIPDLPIFVDPCPLEPILVVDEAAVLFRLAMLLSEEPVNLFLLSELNLLAEGNLYPFAGIFPNYEESSFFNCSLYAFYCSSRAIALFIAYFKLIF